MRRLRGVDSDQLIHGRVPAVELVEELLRTDKCWLSVTDSGVNSKAGDLGGIRADCGQRPR